MRRKSRAFRPESPRLESRNLLSMAAPTPNVPAAVAPMATAAASRLVAFGTLRGQYMAVGEDNRAADAPYHVDVNGGGRLAGLGNVTMRGSIEFGGFLPAGQPDVRGRITLTNARGSVTIELSGSGGFGPIASQQFRLSASVVEGTGAYANLRGIGNALAAFGRNTIVCITTPCPIGGNFALGLALRAPAR